MNKTFRLLNNTIRARAIDAVRNADEGKVIEIKEATRSLDQNAKLWPMLQEVATQVEWYGKKLSAEDWKHVFTAALGKQNVVPGIDGGFVVLGQSTRTMSKARFAELIELIYAFGADHGVKFMEREWKE